ncbi:MAG: hypothetical protein L3J96_06415, partial [Thermoplasmata archaeon]|nr:hypothetical protein [Thermoplasmata archaeon]
RDFAGQLALVKEKVTALLDDFLFGDFGIDPAQTTLVFSGGRGYHVHVHDEAYLTLTSPERREIVEYVTGIGVDPALAILERRESDRAAMALDPGGTDDGGTGRTIGTHARGYKHLAPPDSPGWTGRSTRAVLQLLERWNVEGAAAAAKEIEGFGVPRAKARSLARVLVEKGRGQQIRDRLSLDVFRGEVPKELLEVVLRQAAIEVQGETDAPVTTDVHRLIRLPNSLHGGTGFRVTPLSRESLERFDPMREGPVDAGTGDTTTVEVTESVHYPFALAEVEAAGGDARTLPTPIALFLVLRGEATLRP